ncbi:Superoxide dismutase [Mn], partial [Acropora cervicornis]
SLLHLSQMLCRSVRRVLPYKKVLTSVCAGVSSKAKHELPELPYKYDALKPAICEEIMQLHHKVHHATYVKNLNAAEEKYAEAQAEGGLMDAIQKDFGDFKSFKQQLTTATVAIQGSGWGWLGYNKVTKGLEIRTTANQDPLQPTTGLVPLLGFDVWEHAYYLQYKSARIDYVNAIYDIVSWANVTERFNAAIGA